MQVYRCTIRPSWYAQRPASRREPINSLLIAGHESACRKRGTVDVRHALGLHTLEVYIISLQDFQHVEFLQSLRRRWSFVRIPRGSTFAGPTTPYLPSLTSTLQSGPAVGICFCLIIVRLGHVFAVARDETWHMSSSTPASHPTTSNLTSISFRKVEVKQDTSLGESEDYPMGTLDSQKQEYVNDSDLPEVIRASVALPTPV